MRRRTDGVFCFGANFFGTEDATGFHRIS
jgi:hypothetical protein